MLPLEAQAADVLEDFFLRQRLARQNLEIPRRLVERFVSARRLFCDRLQEFDRALGVVGWRIECYERPQFFAMVRRICEHVMRTHRMPNQNRRAESPSVDHLIQIRYVVPRAVRPFVGPVALAMPALIERERMKVTGKRRRDKVPPMRVRRAAMQEQERALALAAVVKTIQREAVGCEPMCFHIFIFSIFIFSWASRFSPATSLLTPLPSGEGNRRRSGRT